MSAIFDAYEDELVALLGQISQLCVNQNHSAITLLEKAEALNQQMKIELHGVEPHERKVLSVKVQEYQEKIQAISDKLENSIDALDHSFMRGKILARDRKKDTTFKLMGTTDKLNEAKQSAADIEEVAVTIAEALERNKNQIEDTHVKVKSVIDSQRHGGSIIGKMLSRDRRQRVALFVLAAILIIAFLLILYFKFGHRSSKENGRIHPSKTLQ